MTATARYYDVTARGPGHRRQHQSDLVVYQLSGFQVAGMSWQPIWKARCPRGYSFLATSGPVMRLRSGNVEAMIASEAASPPMTVAQYAIPGMLNAMPTWEWR